MWDEAKGKTGWRWCLCRQCGKSTEVPFQPRGDKPVYYSDCYRKVRLSR